ncbi:MAG: hypothetical protein WCP97_05695 [bacterium]
MPRGFRANVERAISAISRQGKSPVERIPAESLDRAATILQSERSQTVAHALARAAEAVL